MAKIGFPKGSGKRLKVREKSVKSQGILKWILSGNPARVFIFGTMIACKNNVTLMFLSMPSTKSTQAYF